jgi:hypothetical protein
MHNNISGSDVPIAPWSGFWYDFVSFIRSNVILLFSLIWFSAVDTNIYGKVILWLCSFILDRIATKKAEDVKISTIEDFKIYAVQHLVKDNSNSNTHIVKRYSNYLLLAICLLIVVEILINTFAIQYFVVTRHIYITIYEIVGLLYFYIVSAYLCNLKMTNERLKYPGAWTFITPVLTWRWVSPFIFIMILMISVVFLHDINTGKTITGHDIKISHN